MMMVIHKVFDWLLNGYEVGRPGFLAAASGAVPTVGVCLRKIFKAAVCAASGA